MTYRTQIIIATAVVTVWTAGRYKTQSSPPVTIPTPTITVSPVPTASPTPILTATPIPTRTPTPTVKPTPTPVVPKYTSEQIYQMIEKYSREKGVDPNKIRHIAVCESGFNPAAKNYIYAGLFQFAPATWKSYRKLMGENPEPHLMFDAQEAVKTAVYLVAAGKTYLWPNCIP